MGLQDLGSDSWTQQWQKKKKNTARQEASSRNLATQGHLHCSQNKLGNVTDPGNFKSTLPGKDRVKYRKGSPSGSAEGDVKLVCILGKRCSCCIRRHLCTHISPNYKGIRSINDTELKTKQPYYTGFL